MTYKIICTKSKQVLTTNLTLDQAHAIARDGRGLIYLPA